MKTTRNLAKKCDCTGKGLKKTRLIQLHADNNTKAIDKIKQVMI